MSPSRVEHETKESSTMSQSQINPSGACSYGDSEVRDPREHWWNFF